MSQTTSAAGRTPSSRRVLTRTVIVLVGVAAFLVVGAFSVSVFGPVGGVEFSPDTFVRREFSYYELPLVRVRVTPVWHKDVSTSLEKRIQKNAALLPPATAAEPRWHLVEMQRAGSQYTEDAVIVCRYFDAQGRDLARWLDWTMKHPRQAEILWPAVASVCRRQLYTFVPDLFDVANQLTVQDPLPKVQQFEAAIHAALARQYFRLADVKQALEQHEAAIELYSAGLSYDADNVSALRARGFSYVAVGDSANARQDRERVKQLQRKQ